MSAIVDDAKRRYWSGWQTASEIFITLGIICSLGGMFMSVHYTVTRPSIPVATEGRIYPWDDHGKVVFVNQRERIVVYSSLFGGWFGIGCGTTLKAYSKRMIKRLAQQS